MHKKCKAPSNIHLSLDGIHRLYIHTYIHEVPVPYDTKTQMAKLVSQAECWCRAASTTPPLCCPWTGSSNGTYVHTPESQI
mmetsp:Transcript_20779/g.34250  ORF Transcript_20779/g.34250 Transcript_20779/m.34250 type:complete len:81 (+) Transcript_20779:252-494(+)